MESIYFWVPMVLVLSAAGIWVFVWAVKDGQFDDLDRPAQQMLMDDDSNPATDVPRALSDVEPITSSRPQGTSRHPHD